jgi:hypothetical protein
VQSPSAADCATACCAPLPAAQAAKAAASQAFTAKTKFADKDSQAAAWAAVQHQLQTSFVAVLERVKRLQAERQLAFSKLLREAQQKGLEALNVDGLMRQLDYDAVCAEDEALAIAKVGLFCQFSSS